MKFTHVAFSDETHHNEGRYRGICLITLELVNLATVKNSIDELLTGSGVREAKWEKLRNAKHRFSAIKLFKYALETIRSRHLRVDVLIWDVHDKRHRVVGRDDTANLHRMHYHLFQNVLTRRWPSYAIWHLYPDENQAIDWDAMCEILTNASARIGVNEPLFYRNSLRLTLKRDFRVEQIAPKRSHEEPLVQLADLFAGVAVYSRTHFDVFLDWKRSRSATAELFPIKPRELTNSETERCRVLDEFEAQCVRNRLSISLESSRRLKTRNPAEGLNFWWYEPQHSKDIAPGRKK